MESQLVNQRYLSVAKLSSQSMNLSYVGAFKLYAQCIFGITPGGLIFDHSMNFDVFKLRNGIVLTDEKEF